MTSMECDGSQLSFCVFGQVQSLTFDVVHLQYQRCVFPYVSFPVPFLVPHPYRLTLTVCVLQVCTSAVRVFLARTSAILSRLVTHFTTNNKVTLCHGYTYCVDEQNSYLHIQDDGPRLSNSKLVLITDT